jgi:hypothetical protein
VTVVAWIGLITALTWFIMFIQIAKNEIREEPTTNGYRAVCLLFLLVTVALSIVTNIGVII